MPPYIQYNLKIPPFTIIFILVLVTVTIYGLFLYDSKAREGTWEHLDDAVYYVRSLGNTVEFCFAVFLFFNGGWILLFESGGTIRALMMLIHAYCNIWCEAKSGKMIDLYEKDVARLNCFENIKCLHIKMFFS